MAPLPERNRQPHLPRWHGKPDRALSFAVRPRLPNLLLQVEAWNTREGKELLKGLTRR